MNAETLKELLANATPGPWVVESDESSAQVKGFPCIVTDKYTVVGSEGMYGDIDIDYANARLIALAPQLAADNIALQAEVERLKNEIEEIMNEFEDCLR